MAAEVAAQAGATVTLFEGKPSVGRKFLVAGHGGLNLTHSDPLEQFSRRYEGSLHSDYWTSLLNDFGNDATRRWASGLGIETFIGTSGRVFPKELKAAPLLRSWVRRLRSLGVRIKTRHHLHGVIRQYDRFNLSFSTHEGVIQQESDAVILALGGASWPKTGSDARWVPLLESLGLCIIPLAPANCGWEVNWGDFFVKEDILPQIEGSPLKNITVSADGRTIAGELLITKYGVEGGALYQLGSMLRAMENPQLSIDLKPSFSEQEMNAKIASLSGDLIDGASKAWRLSQTGKCLLRQAASNIPGLDIPSLSKLAKHLPLPLSGPRTIGEAISSAGGVSFDEVDENLMVKRMPGLFLSGEMLDWEAPTGGYLIQGCLATGTRAANGSISYLQTREG